MDPAVTMERAKPDRFGDSDLVPFEGKDPNRASPDRARPCDDHLTNHCSFVALSTWIDEDTKGTLKGKATCQPSRWHT